MQLLCALCAFALTIFHRKDAKDAKICGALQTIL
jgi:hypothetical protein